MDSTGSNKVTILEDKYNLRILFKQDSLNISIYMAIMSICSAFLNGLVIYLIKKHRPFQKPNIVIRAAYAVFDMSFGVLSCVHALLYLHADGMPEWMNCVLGNVVIALFFCTLLFTAFISLEKYVFFCRPYIYQRYFSNTFIIGISVGIAVTTQLYVHLKYLTTNRILQPLYGTCVSSDQTFHNRVNLVIFVLPTICCTFYSLVKIRIILNRISNTPPDQQQHEQAESKMRANAVKKGLRYVW